MRVIGWIFGISWALALGAGIALGAESADAAEAVAPAAQATDDGEGTKAKPTAPVVTQHSIEIDGQRIEYTATAGEIILEDREQAPTARIFYVAYSKVGAEPAQRPLTFSFNGGPGSSSIWMHMGLLGPKRVKMDADGFGLAPPHVLVDNGYSLLDSTDLVFIDPVSTGFSRPVDMDKEKGFHGLDEDVQAVGDFVRRYVTENARWASPKFLIGESYGTTRAAALALHLQERHGMYLNGIMLVSAVLDFATLRYAEGNDLPNVLFLPSMAATAWYHGKLEPALQRMALDELLAQVEAFATGPYQAALFAGAALDAGQFAAIAQQFAAYTGISAEQVERAQLRYSVFDFFGDLLASEGERIGRFDGRYRGVAAQEWERHKMGAGPDPSYTQLYGAYASAFNDYIRRELKYETTLPYEVLASVRPWNFGPEFSTRYVNISDRLREALVMNPHLQVQVCSGYFDLATPYFATDYTLQRLYLHPQLRDNIHTAYYAGGHMMYTIEAELARQKAVLAAFIRKAAQSAH